MEHDDEQEGMSTGKKALAGAAVGIAVPAAVTVAKKLMSDGNDDEGTVQKGQQRTRQTSQRTASSAQRSSKGSSRSGRSSASGSKSSRSSGTKARSSSSRARSRSSSPSSRSRGNRTKEQLYNRAKRLKIPGRSSMTKQQLERAISRASS
jgi:hypothetical protein